MARFAFLSGWRKGELQSLSWSDVNRDDGIVTLRPEHSKNGGLRVLPLVGDLATIIDRRWGISRRPRLPSGRPAGGRLSQGVGDRVRRGEDAWLAVSRPPAQRGS